MQIKEFEALTLKECLQRVRDDMGPDAVILETRKFRKGGLMGVGAHDAIAIVAATGIVVESDKIAESGAAREKAAQSAARRTPEDRGASVAQSEAQSGQRTKSNPVPVPGNTSNPGPSGQSSQQGAPRTSAARIAARGVYGVKSPDRENKRQLTTEEEIQTEDNAFAALLAPDSGQGNVRGRQNSSISNSRPPTAPKPLTPSTPAVFPANGSMQAPPPLSRTSDDSARFTYLERAMGEIRDCLVALQREQRDANDRTVSAVVSAVAPAISAVNAAGYAALSDDLQPRFPELQQRLRQIGVSDTLVQELFDQLPDMGAWSAQAQEALALSALKDLITRRVPTSGPISLTPGQAKVVALIGPTGVGKTTTIAKLAANFALMQGKRVALITVDTYRIAAVEQLKTYSQIIGLPVSVAYSHAEIPKIMQQYEDYDLILIDTAGRSPQHTMQVGELKSLLDTVRCETHLVLSAQTKEQDMVDAIRRFSVVGVDRLIVSKLDETSSYGTLLNVVDQTGLPLSYITTGQKVPEDLETAEGGRLAEFILA